ncbi:astacin [Ostertagia ostertagi]
MNKPIEDVNAESGIADALFQGDILLSKEQQEQIVADGSGDRFKRQARNDDTYPVKKWPSLEVKYALDRNLGGNAKIAVKRAAEIWTNNTCINITLDEEEEADELILVYKEYGCWGEVGKQDGWQFISLGEQLRNGNG